jgi:UDP-GlcNAc:undecaprenyl-phosphate/decaprenyl-phosphate GlcNAc-1-phosphate transferase
MPIAPLIVTIIAAFILVTLLIPVVRTFAIRSGITDRPAEGKVHRLPTPYLGGVAISMTAIGLAVFLRGWSREAAAIAAGAVLIAVVGLIDDIRNLDPRPRLAAEIVAALLAASAGARVHIFGNWLDWVATVMWLVVITNSFNLLDNMDGAATAIAMVTAGGVLVAAILEEQVLIAGLASLLVGACLGFLIYNWNPARIFMGDAGSLFLGYMLAVTALKLRFPVGRTSGLVAVVLLTGPALFDTTLVVLSRMRAGRKIYIGGTDHTSHRLLRLGLGTRMVTLVLALVCVLSVSLGVAVGRGRVSPWLALVPLVAAAAVLLRMLLRMQVYAEAAAREVARKRAVIEQQRESFGHS